MSILTINPGSTAVKYALFDTESGEVLESRQFSRKQVASIAHDERAWLEVLSDVERIGIRVVHGGGLRGPLRVDNGEIAAIRRAAKYAPVHNAFALEVIQLLQKVLPRAPVVASFDSDFHLTMPDYARTYPIPRKLAHEHQLERHGFHGVALQSIMAQLAERLGAVPERVICAHLGGGCSITAVKNGQSVDTSMGLSPLDGIMMTTRSGSVDPFVVDAVELDVLHTQSGFLGLTGSQNTLEIIQRGIRKQEPERLALDMFVHQIVKYVYAYFGVLQGCDVLVFSGGIGEGNAQLRARILKELAMIGLTEETVAVVKVDEARTLFENARNV